MGVSYRRLGRSRAGASFEGIGVFYGSSPSDARQFTGGSVFVVGGANSAGQAAVHLRRYAASVTLVCRSALETSMSQYLLDEIEGQANIHVRKATQVVDAGGEQPARDADPARARRATETVPADALFVLIGAEPRTDWLPDGDRPRRARLRADGAASTCSTSVPGVFAIGDVRCGSVKRVASAVGEGSVVIQHVHRYLESVEARSHAH